MDKKPNEKLNRLEKIKIWFYIKMISIPKPQKARIYLDTLLDSKKIENILKHKIGMPMR